MADRTVHRCIYTHTQTHFTRRALLAIIQHQVHIIQHQVHIIQHQLHIIQRQAHIIQHQVHIIQHQVHIIQYQAHIIQHQVHIIQHQVHIIQHQVHIIQHQVHIIQHQVHIIQHQVHIIQHQAHIIQHQVHIIHQVHVHIEQHHDLLLYTSLSGTYITTDICRLSNCPNAVRPVTILVTVSCVLIDLHSVRAQNVSISCQISKTHFCEVHIMYMYNIYMCSMQADCIENSLTTSI